MTESTTQHFLIVFDHARNEQVHLEEFGTDYRQALKAYDAMEQRYGLNAAVDIVLVGSDSLASVKITHSTYFPDFSFMTSEFVQELVANR